VVSVSQVLVILLRRGWIVALAFLTTTVVAGGVLLFVPSRYDAIATASIDPGNIDPISETSEAAGSSMIMLMQGNMISLVTSDRVALDVVRRLNLTASPLVQESFRESTSFGRESVEDWMASILLKNVDPKFNLGTNVLSIKYKSDDPNQSALIANAFLAATIDGSVAMKAAAADQTARWFAPQLEDLRKELESARTALATFQAKANMVAPTAGGDSETSQYMAISAELSSATALLTAMQSRLESGSTELSNDPSDPDLQVLAGLKERLSTTEAGIESAKGILGANNPKMVADQASLASIRRQLTEATDKMRQHLKERIATTQSQIASLEAAQAQAQKKLIEVQAQRDRMGELQRDVGFRVEQLNGRERAAEQAKLQSKLTFSDITVLDKATPPIDPAFPKPIIVIPVGIAAGLALGLLLALLAEATDRRVRFPPDLEFAAPAPFLGSLDSARSRSRLAAARRRLRAA
jgi:succinoglycan biosynthesis transport protein ExoP